MKKTLSSYSRVPCSRQCNSNSRRELGKVTVGFKRGLADERKYWVPTIVHSQTYQQNIMFNKHRSRGMVLLEQAVAVWACWKSTFDHQLILNVLLGFFWRWVTPPPLNLFLTFKLKIPNKPKNLFWRLLNRKAFELVVFCPKSSL